MSILVSRIFLIYKLLNILVLYLVPKKLRKYLPTSWYPCHQQYHHQQQNFVKKDDKLPIPRKMDTNDLNRCFQIFDIDGDGQITKKELNDSLEKIGIFIPDGELTQLIENVDANVDGCVDIDEFGELYRAIMDGRDEPDVDMKEAFSVFDRNGDGLISHDELKEVLCSLGLKQGEIGEDCEKMINRVDLDGDGMVDFHEFKDMMKGGGNFATLIN